MEIGRQLWGGRIHRSLTLGLPLWRPESRPFSPPPAPGAHRETIVLGVVGEPTGIALSSGSRVASARPTLLADLLGLTSDLTPSVRNAV